jgi:hypothetical protein
MKILKQLIIIIFIIDFSGSLSAQFSDSARNVQIGFKYKYGFLYAHHQSFNYFTKDYIRALDASVDIKVNGSKEWHNLYNRPRFGFGYYRADLGNPRELGYANAVFSSITFTLFNFSQFDLLYKSSGGIAYLSKKFDLYQNKYNIAIGSHLNAYLNMSFDLSYLINQNWALNFGFGLTHFSNGGYQQPNKGLNIMNVQAGLSYQFNRNIQSFALDTSSAFKKANNFTFFYAVGIKTLEPARQTKYLVSIFSLNFERQYCAKGKIGIGLDLFKDNSRAEYLIEEGIEDARYSNLFYAGSHLSYDLVFGKTSFTMQMGAYFWQKSKHFENVYHRFGIRYQFSGPFIASLTLKTFWAAADFAEWGIAFRF